MASLSVSSKTPNSITVRLSGLDSSYTGKRNYYWYIDGVYDGDSTSSGSTTSKTHTFSGLEPNTEYTMQCAVQWWTDNGNGEEQYSRFSVTEATGAATRPEDWEWWHTIAKGAEIKLSADEWNAFTECINAFRLYAGLSAYSFTTAVSGETKISAAIVNQARTAISAISGHGTLPSAAVAKKAITASFFNGLKNALNAID